MSRRPTSRFIQRDRTTPALDTVADNDPPTTPPPPPKARPPGPPPPPKARPPAPPKAPTPKATPITPPPSKRRSKAPPKGKRPPQKKRPAIPKKGKPGQPPIATKKKGRRIKIKLGLRAKKLSEEVDTYTDQIGWTSSSAETILSDLKDFEEEVRKEPETTTHRCSMCGVRMEIPTPKRDRYKVICAYPECGHEDTIGI